MNIKSVTKVIGSLCLLFAAGCISGLAQGGVQTRSISSDDFASKRPVRSKATVRPQKFNYKFVRSDKSPVRRSNTSKPPPPKRPTTVESFTEIGVTVWKLRPPVGTEAGYMMPVLLENKESGLWLAERVGTESVFSAGDKVRFAVESSVPGHLYVFDRETYSDGTFGEPYLIFPESLAEDNSVGPGLIADIPDQRDDFPYFNIKARQPNHRGELLTVIISPRPLKTFMIDDEGKLRNPENLIELELDSETEIFSREDGANKIFSKVESNSTCGVKTRQLERVKSDKPCGNASRLGPDEPLPQSIYRVKMAAGKPSVIFVKLSSK